STLHLIPQLWFRNTWAWGAERGPEPTIKMDTIGGRATAPKAGAPVTIVADDRTADALSNLTFTYRLGERRLSGPAGGKPLFTNNESNGRRLWGPTARCAPANLAPCTKDAFHRQIVDGEDAVNPDRVGTKACIHYEREIPPGASFV